MCVNVQNPNHMVCRMNCVKTSVDNQLRSIELARRNYECGYRRAGETTKSLRRRMVLQTMDVLVCCFSLVFDTHLVCVFFCVCFRRILFTFADWQTFNRVIMTSIENSDVINNLS